MDLHMWLLMSFVLLVEVQAEPPTQSQEPNQSTKSHQKPQQRYKEVIMYLTPSQIKSLESGEGYIVPHPTAQPSLTTNSQGIAEEGHAYEAALQEHHHQQQEHQQQQQQELQLNQQQDHQKQELQLHQQQQQQKQELQQQQQQQLQQQKFHLQQDEADRKHRLHLQEANQNEPTSLLDQNTYEHHVNQQNFDQWNAQSYPQIQQQPQTYQLIPSTQNDHYLQFGKSQPLPDNYAYMYFYPKGKPQSNENIQLVQPNPNYSEQIKLLHLEPNRNHNLPLIEISNNEHHHPQFDQQKHKQLINYLVPDKFKLLPYEYAKDQTLDDLLAQQHLESQHLKTHQQVHLDLENQQQFQLQHQLQSQNQIELGIQHQALNQIQLDVQHQIQQEAHHQIQQTQQEIQHNIQLQAQQLSQLDSLQKVQLEIQQEAQHQAQLQIKPKQLEVQTFLPKEINLKELEDHIKQHIKSQDLYRQLANQEQQAKIQEIENEKKKEIEIANMDAHHESQQIKAEQVKAEEIIKSGQIRAQHLEAQIAAENLNVFAKLESSRANTEKKQKEQELFTPFKSHQNIIDSFNQNKQKLESGFIPIASITQDNSNNKLPKEVEKILLKNEVEKQKALAKAAEIAKEPAQVIKEEIKVVKRPQEVRVKEVHVPTPIFVPYPKPIEVKMPQPFFVPVEVLRHVPVPIVHTEKVEVEKRVPVEVKKVVHVPVTKNVYVPVDKPYIVEKLVPFEVEKKVPVPIRINKPQKFTIIRHVWKH